MRPNAFVQKEIDRLKEEWWLGVDEGYESAASPLPAWYSQKTLNQLTARERGHVFGRELKLSEKSNV